MTTILAPPLGDEFFITLCLTTRASPNVQRDERPYVRMR
jgi:hypothetical protein